MVRWLDWRWCLVRWWFRRRPEVIGQWIGRHSPRYLTYWITLGGIVRCTTGPYGSDDPGRLHATEILERLEHRGGAQ